MILTETYCTCQQTKNSSRNKLKTCYWIGRKESRSKNWANHCCLVDTLTENWEDMIEGAYVFTQIRTCYQLTSLTLLTYMYG